ncbi:MAG: FKBP-type peptidyl-prolyl cis-trans isomerase [Nitriliruptoraceae bacterium]
MGRMPHARALALLVAGLVAIGCSDEGDRGDAVAAPEEETVSQDVGERPETSGLIPADTDPPTALVVEDVAVGDGPAAADGDRLAVDYVGVRWSDGGEFDASWERGQPIEFVLGAGRVIPGWEQGLEGMQVGGRRIITIPPELAYGDRGAGAAIGPGETLVFVVDLVAIG